MSDACSHGPMAPTIETPRLTMRAHRLADFEQCAAMWGDPAVTRFIGGKPSTEQQTWSRMLSYVGHWSLMGFGYWALEEKATGSFAGELGFADFRRDVAAPMRGAPELGFALASRFHGRGYATEALSAAVTWGDVRFGRTRTVCMIDPDNVASLRAVRRCGYEVLDRAFFNAQPILFLARDVR